MDTQEPQETKQPVQPEPKTALQEFRDALDKGRAINADILAMVTDLLNELRSRLG
jgi:hypothetical protein